MTVGRGLAFFVIITVAGLMGVFLYTTSLSDLPQIVQGLSPGWLALCLVVPPLADWFVSGLRMYLFTTVTAPKVTLLGCVRTCAVGAFVNAATPSQTGGGVAQIYALTREGATPGAALGILWMTFLATLLYYCLAAIALWKAASLGVVPGIHTSLPFIIAAGLFGGFSMLLLVALAHPVGALALLQRVTNWLERWRLPSSIARKINDALDECGDTVGRLAFEHKLRFAVAIGLSVVIFGNKYFAAYFAVRALGLSPPLLDLLIIQVFINVLIYFFPTPGGSGGAEVGGAVLMSRMVPGHLLGPITILWRSATVYLSVIVGGILLMRHVKRASADRDGVDDDLEAVERTGEATSTDEPTTPQS
ncbi:MAG: lysylphosphatidylglycerol synthase transmembrane domain-containing protein [Candidatus Latescibacteria bacterium]|jgi:hypothetical protein|nr:lysylphosphatidylglycerol synthase transmembrane domain-containing protein [Candidatus Latescibacterota bacterium]